MVLGLPGLIDGPLLRTARDIGAPILISANSLSRWAPIRGIREWQGFKTKPLELATGMEVWLDSAGFTAMKKYNGFPWTAEAYVELAASFPFEKFASLDYCVEEEVAGSQGEVWDRISRTISANRHCRRLAADYGIVDRFMPVIQGRSPDDYLRCIDRMPLVFEHSVVGVGSMCRRHTNGAAGILSVVAALERGFAGTDVQLHLFGLKSQGAAAVRGHPRIYSVDSQAYGTAARWNALHAGHSKTNEYVARVMADWMDGQVKRLRSPGFCFQEALALPAAQEASTPSNRPQDAHARMNWAERHAREHFRVLMEEGELDHDQCIERYVEETAYEIFRGPDRPWMARLRNAIRRALIASRRRGKKPLLPFQGLVERRQVYRLAVLAGAPRMSRAYPFRCWCGLAQL
jgi:hypothetical protein